MRTLTAVMARSRSFYRRSREEAARRRTLEREIAGFTTPSEIAELEALLERQPDAQIERLLARRH